MSQIALRDSYSLSVTSNEATVVEIVEDLDSMKLSGKKPPSFSDMPLAVLHNILDHVKPIDRLIVRKVSRRFRDTVDDHDPGFKAMVVLTGAREDVILKFDDLCVFYCRNGAGCSIKFNKHGALREKKIKNGSYLKLASADLKMIINNPKLRLESFELDFVKIPYTADQKANMEVVQMLLKSPKKLDVEKLKIVGFHQEQIPMVLQYFERDHIQELNFGGAVCLGHPGRYAELKQLSHIQIQSMKKVAEQDAAHILELLKRSATIKSINITSCFGQDFSEAVKILQPNFARRPSGGTDFSINGKEFHVEFNVQNIKIEKKVR